MRNRLVRLCVVLVLGASAAVAARQLRGELQMIHSTALADLDQRVDRLLALTTELRRAQAGYVVPGENPTRALEAFPGLLQDVTNLTVSTGSVVHASAASTELRALADGTSRLAEADAAAREHLLVGDVLTASHVIFGQASQAADAMTAAVLGVRGAERTAQFAAMEESSKQAQTIAAGVGALWIAGLLLLAFIPGRPRDAGVSATPTGESPLPPAVDLGEAADLCTAISRVETTPALTDLLARAVSLLEAEGVIVWMATPHGELVPAATAGYAPGVAARLTPTRRQDDSVTAIAWREGATKIVEGSGQAGAVVAIPLFSSQGCCGVFALELRAPSADPATRHVARMIAAQLASVVVGAGGSTAPSSVAAGR